MKKNGLQVISLVLNVALLVGLFWVGSEVKELRREAWDQHRNIYNEIDATREQVHNIRLAQREQTELVEDFHFEPTDLNEETRRLEGTMNLSLRRWAADTDVILLVELNGETWELPMTGESGTFETVVGLPVTEHGELIFTALITSQGETNREQMMGYGDFSMLLPLQSDGGGWDGPEYRDGVLSSHFNVSVTGRDYQHPGEIRDPKFQVYRNGELVQTIAAVIDPYSGSSNGVNYTVDAEDYRWSLECDEGDIIEIRFCCQDEYGLGYDFLFGNWTVEGEKPEWDSMAGAMSGLGDLELTWPE